MTDLDRADDLDHLTSEELEAEVFGPAPRERRSIRGLVQRPAGPAVRSRVATRTPRWKQALVGVAALGAGLVGLELVVGDPDDRAAEAPVDARMDAEMDALQDAMDAEMDALDAEMDALDDALDGMGDGVETTERTDGGPDLGGE